MTGAGTNTQLTLLYRDACNYKTTGEVVFKGTPTPKLVARLMATLSEGEYLVPEQVGLTHPATQDPMFASRFPDEQDDHGFVEVATHDVVATHAPADDERTFAAFVDACEKAAAQGWDPMLAINAAGDWTDPELAARLRNGDADQ